MIHLVVEASPEKLIRSGIPETILREQHGQNLRIGQEVYQRLQIFSANVENDPLAILQEIKTGEIMLNIGMIILCARERFNLCYDCYNVTRFAIPHKTREMH